ncbi:MAG: DUF4178 domain-containing protein, partial [Proteobacteria bacterium]|nr:DUF4178 domain-containing protein [Pseudomonadota bacterium]
MKVACPTCGADVEFRYDDSFVRVCEACRSAVLRTDRGIETLGTVADLVPMESPLALFAEGTCDGETFLLVGMAQIKHAQGGTWQEWYAKFGGERWGWLAEAQGRFYLTFETELQSALPAFEALAPGRTVTLRVAGQPRSFVVGEVGEATLVAAAGEIPYRLEPNATTRYVDLSSAQGDFATIDYTDEVPRTYLGKQLALADLKIVGGEVVPAHASTATASRVACPSCNGSLELRAPDQTQRVGCPFCAHLIDVSDGKLSVLAKLAVKPVPAIPLGAKGRF